MAMQKLNVRFSDEMKDYLSNTSASYDLNDSAVARAALNIGLDAINKAAYSFKKRGENPELVSHYVAANQ